jgi:serine/alanine adding enzyme
MNSVALEEERYKARNNDKDKKITTIDPITDKRWDVFITSHPESTIFHHSAWARVLAESYQCRPAYYVLEDERREILAAAPFIWIKSHLTGKRLVCLPQCELCFPLAYREEDLGALVTRVRQDVDDERHAYLEIRGWGSLGAATRFGLEERSYFLTHIVSLDADPQKVRSRLDYNGRYNLRYAEKSPFTIRLGQGEADLREFHRLNTEIRRKHNLLPQPYHFFKSIYENLIIPGYGYLLFAELKGKAVAAHMNFCFRDTVSQEFNAQDQSYLKYRPNYLLVWKTMEQACRESYRYYDFGRTQPENQPLANFKRHWGSKETVLPYYYYPRVCGIGTVSRRSPRYRAYTTINKCLPSFMFGITGDIMHRHMG